MVLNMDNILILDHGILVCLSCFASVLSVCALHVGYAIIDSAFFILWVIIDSIWPKKITNHVSAILQKD